MDIQIQIVFKLILAIILGAIIGIERERKGKPFGLMALTLVSFGSCLFAIISLAIFEYTSGRLGANFDVSNIIVSISIIMGLISAGIAKKEDLPESVSLAVGFWCVAGIGLSVGFGFYLLSCFATIMLLAIFFISGKFGKKIVNESNWQKKRK